MRNGLAVLVALGMVLAASAATARPVPIAGDDAQGGFQLVKNRPSAAAPARPKTTPPAVKPAPESPVPPDPVTPPQPADPQVTAPAPAVTPTGPQPILPPPPERVEVDVSTRTVAVTSVFSGTEITIFGTVINSRQASAESGFYDLVVIVEGHGAPSIVRLKSNVGGLWVNTQSVRFDTLPLYSAIASTRPIDEIADPRLLASLAIGFGRARMFPGKRSSKISVEELDDYRSAAIRIKQKDGLYVRHDYGVAFIGPALFRASVKLPANVPVGPLDAHVFLFRDGQLLATQTANVMLERQGVDRLVYDFAFDHPVWYGLLAVMFAASAGLAASVIFQRQAN